MNMKDVIKSQYRASLGMMEQAIVKCPEALWDDRGKKNRYWHIAYHALFYTHLYVMPTEGAFTPWEKHIDEYQYMGRLPTPPHDPPQIGDPYSKEEVLAYYEQCRKQVDETVDSLDIEAESGFSWLPMGKLELQFYSIRHLQMHVGELCERLGSEANIDVDWMGMRPDVR